MKTLNIKKTILPEEKFNSHQEWLESIGVKPSFKEDGTSIKSMVDHEDFLSDVRNRFFSDPGILHYCFAHKTKTKNR